MAVADGVPIRTTHPQANGKCSASTARCNWPNSNASPSGALPRLDGAGRAPGRPGAIDVRGELVCGRDVFIDVNCVFEGKVVLEEAVEVGPACVLKNARIGAGSRLAAFSHIEDAIVGPDGVIGPFARLRPGTELAAGVHVGNFVELKNSKFRRAVEGQSPCLHRRRRSSAAGSISVPVRSPATTTAPTSSRRSSRTMPSSAPIRNLVAPVTVGRGATLGAGTTLTKDAPPDTLTISRARQISISGWKRPVKKPRSELTMCGIVAAVADRNIVPVLLEGLRKLEYRGYDSAGLALINDSGLHRLRSVGRVAELTAQVEERRRPAHRHRAHALGDARRAQRAQRPSAHLGRAGRRPQRDHRKPRGAARPPQGLGTSSLPIPTPKWSPPDRP
jgi:acetyltransferase-like isoleucine patch superfamily enzyme